MNEQQLEILNSLVTTPYVWIILGFAILLSYSLKFIRKFYSQKWKEEISKEEEIMVNLKKTPEMKFANKIVFVSMWGSDSY